MLVINIVPLAKWAVIWFKSRNSYVFISTSSPTLHDRKHLMLTEVTTPAETVLHTARSGSREMSCSHSELNLLKSASLSYGCCQKWSHFSIIAGNVYTEFKKEQQLKKKKQQQQQKRKKQFTVYRWQAVLLVARDSWSSCQLKMANVFQTTFN